MSYLLEISPSAQKEIKQLRAHIRNRIRKAVKALAKQPRPSRSEKLDFDLKIGEPRRLRLEHWRVIYAVVETDLNFVSVVAIRRRPPYDYDDLPDLFDDFLCKGYQERYFSVSPCLASINPSH